jgi:putative protease
MRESSSVNTEKYSLPRLLSPIKSFSGAVKVLEAGADEIYCGVRTPGLEDFQLYRGVATEIPSYEELEKVTEYAHNHLGKVLLTVNQPFMTDSMEEPLTKHIRTCVDKGIDALIIGDLGILQLAKSIADVPLYASTYLSAMNSEAVEFLRRSGFSRVILERHVPFEQIAEITKSSNVDVEVFIHGSGCSNVNVNCYLFHYKFPAMEQGLLKIDGIKFPCSLPFSVYEDDGNASCIVQILDAYTFCSLCKLPSLIKSGVTGLKIEGRGINEDYQVSTTKMYKDSIDLIRNGDLEGFQEKLKKLQETFIPLPHDLPLNNLKELCCEQNRCYYSPQFHAPYKKKLAWQTWTKLQCKLLVLQ